MLPEAPFSVSVCAKWVSNTQAAPEPEQSSTDDSLSSTEAEGHTHTVTCCCSTALVHFATL